MTCRSPVLVWMIALTVALGGIGTGFAHGTPPAAAMTTLCIGGAVVTVALDGEGRPIPATHVCSDCVIAGAPGFPQLATGSAPRPHDRASVPSAQCRAPQHPAPLPPSRAPPRPV